MMSIKADSFDIEAIRRINKTAVNDDGTVKSFKEQLLEYEYGYYNATLPFIVSPTSAPLMQAGAKDYPITMAPGILTKLMNRHGIYPRDIAELPTLIRDSNVLMLDSYTYRRGGLCMYLDERGSNDIPLFAAFHLNKVAALTSINELLSIYERANIAFTIRRTWEKGLNLYPNEKTAGWIQSLGLRLPGDISTLLNGNYRSVSKDRQVPARPIIANPQVNDKMPEKLYSLTSECRSARSASHALGSHGHGTHKDAVRDVPRRE